MGETGKIAKCARCSTTFVKFKAPVCENCVDDEEADFTRISDALVENPDQNAEVIAQLANVSTACVLRMLDRGLIATEQIAPDVKCGRCGKPAISLAKKLCQSCLIKLDQNFMSEISHAKRAQTDFDPTSSVHDIIDTKRKSIANPKKH